MKKQKIKQKKTKRILRRFLRREKKSVKDIAILAIMLTLFVISAIILIRQTKEENRQEVVENPKPPLETPTFDTTDWKIYQNSWYGFKLKYPEDLEQVTSQKPLTDSKWEYKYQFRKKETDENNPYVGFNIVVYNVNKVKELASTEEHPSFKFELNENETCRFIPEHMRDESTFFSVEMYIPPTDDCYNPAFFYSIISDKYIFNITPVLGENQKAPADLKKFTINNFPEFISIASSFDLFAVKKVGPQINPQPVARGGTKCPAEVDRPSISSRKNKNHMDEDCCPDFDEWPKPGCAYTAKDFIIMLKSPTSGHVKSSQASKVKALLKGK